MDNIQLSKKIRRQVLKMIFDSGASHVGSNYSIVDILIVLYYEILFIDPNNPLKEDRDRFILSKGHSIAALYAVLAEKGFFNKELLDTFYKDGSSLPGHSTKGSVPGVEVSTGSLGHGLPIGAGMALAGKKDKRNYRVLVLMSDGECNEGSSWEAIMFASHHKLDNLTVIIDYNKFTSMGEINKIINIEPLAERWASFGWQVQEIDGHNFSEIKKSLEAAARKKGKPHVIIAHTVKGRGVSFMEKNILWHYRCPDKGEFDRALKELI